MNPGRVYTAVPSPSPLFPPLYTPPSPPKPARPLPRRGIFISVLVEVVYFSMYYDDFSCPFRKAKQERKGLVSGIVSKILFLVH